MKLEHVGLLVDHPISKTERWIENLGFRCLRKSGTDEYGVAFLCDNSGSVIGLANLKELKALDLHQPELSPHNDYPDENVILRDPCGACIQLLRRKDKLPEAGI
jgi:hypothetical protein